MELEKKLQVATIDDFDSGYMYHVCIGLPKTIVWVLLDHIKYLDSSLYVLGFSKSVDPNSNIVVPIHNQNDIIFLVEVSFSTKLQCIIFLFIMLLPQNFDNKLSIFSKKLQKIKESLWKKGDSKN